jgi:uncharacterized membrane protein
MSEIGLYIAIKWFHVLGVCIGFGSNVTHIFWLLSANADIVSGAEKLRVVKKIDDRLAVPAYVVAIGCGIAMWLWRWPLMSSWIIVSLVLSIVLTVMGISFGPFMKRWIMLAGEQPGGEQLLRLSRRLTMWWIFIAATVLIILYMMVLKPVYW